MPSDNPSPDDIFVCKQCGDCCRGYGGTYVTPADIAAIAAYIQVDADRFVEDFCVFSGSRPVLAQKENGYCVFWDKLCTIHPVKPRMCRAWPYIESVLKDVANWEVMASACPGIRADVPPETIRQQVRRHLAEMNTGGENMLKAADR
ncbi:MAG: YkgJ family cysteine cluster protein [Thermodesulfobacteriota bacterium]